MAQRFSLARLLLSALPVLALAPAVGRIFAQAPAPTRILACESTDNTCQRPDAHLDMTWVFDGTEGTAVWPANPTGSHVTIEKFDSGSIVVQRVDDGGPTPGLTAVYTGAVQGTHMSGTVQWTWPGHPGYPASGSFSAVLQDQLAAAPAVAASPSSANLLPPELLVCENNGMCNAAWVLNSSGGGTATWFGRNVTRATLTVVRSAPDDILIRRTDTTDAVSAVYAGSLRGDHYSGTIVYSSPGHPGDNTGTWTATIPQTHCDAQAGLAPDQAMSLGQSALMFHRDRDALGCYTVAARAGDATAQTAVGLTYYQGREGIPQDYAQALIWLQKAADQGVYNAQRTVAEMYLAGQGTAANPTMASIYTRRADEQQHNIERQQDLEDRAADRRAQVLSSFVMGASFGLFF